MKRVHVFIAGTVQGVSFRATTKQKAKENNVAGWVRNLEDGRVEAVFEGHEEAIESMIQYCHHGPNLAEVENVEIQYEEAQRLEDFKVRR